MHQPPDTPPDPTDVRCAVAVVRTADADPRYLILQRARHPDDPWSGHLAFPGGRREEQDRHLLDTCVRETREECGLDLSPFATAAEALPVAAAGGAVGRHLWVQPYLFIIPAVLPVTPCEREIARAFWVPASDLCRHDRHAFAPMSAHVQDTLFPFVPVADAQLWGFTYHLAMRVLDDPAHRHPDHPAPPRLHPRPA